MIIVWHFILSAHYQYILQEMNNVQEECFNVIFLCIYSIVLLTQKDNVK